MAIKANLRLAIVVVLGVVLAISRIAFSLEYYITDLGTLGGSESKATEIDEYGQIVGWAKTISGKTHAFIYYDSVMNDISTLGGNTSEAYGINDDGRIVGQSVNGSGQKHAFLYEDGIMHDLGTLGGNESYASAINNVGQIACSSKISSGRWRTAIYENGIMKNLGSLGGNHSWCNAINNSGQIVGSSDVRGGSPWHACLWENNTMTDLGVLSGTWVSTAIGINDRGQIVGKSNNYPSLPVRGFLYENGVMKGIGSLGHSPDDTRAHGINNIGQIVGRSKATDDNNHAFLYQDGIMTDLGTLGGNSSSAEGINENGWIVGWAETTEGETHAVLWRPLPLGVAVDIKPESCPNPLNLVSKGVLPIAILGTEDFDVNDISIASIRLDGVAPFRESYEDVATPVPDGNECECTEAGPDGYIDLTLKFKTQDIVEELIKTHSELAKGQTLTMTLTGELFDDAAIIGNDCVVLVGNVPKWLAARGSDINGDGVVNILDFALMAEYWLESTIY